MSNYACYSICSEFNLKEKHFETFYSREVLFGISAVYGCHVVKNFVQKVQMFYIVYVLEKYMLIMILVVLPAYYKTWSSRLVYQFQGSQGF